MEHEGVVGEDPCSGPGPGLDSGGRTEGPDAMPSGAGLCWDAPAVASGVRVVFLVTRQLACYIEVLLTLDIFSVRGFLCLVGCPSLVNLGSRSTWLTGLSWGSCPWSAWVLSTQRVPCGVGYDLVARFPRSLRRGSWQEQVCITEERISEKPVFRVAQSDGKSQGELSSRGVRALHFGVKV